MGGKKEKKNITKPQTFKSYCVYRND